MRVSSHLANLARPYLVTDMASGG